MEAREYIVLHTTGATWVKAPTAAAALQKCCVPGGFRHARAVIEAAIAVGNHNSQPHQGKAPFLAIVGKSAVAETK